MCFLFSFPPTHLFIFLLPLWPQLRYLLCHLFSMVLAATTTIVVLTQPLFHLLQKDFLLFSSHAKKAQELSLIGAEGALFCSRRFSDKSSEQILTRAEIERAIQLSSGHVTKAFWLNNFEIYCIKV